MSRQTQKAVGHREPLFHIAKRASLSLGKAIFIRSITILLALGFAGLLTLIVLHENPFRAYGTMFSGVFGGNTLVSFRATAILLCISLALVPAFKMRFWNIGAEGQILVGCFATAASMYYFGHLPTPVLIAIMVVTALAAGALWGIIPAVFKAVWGTNETLFTLMMNSVAVYIIAFFMKIWNPKANSVSTEILDKEFKIFSVFGTNYWLVIGIVLVLAVLMYIYMNYTKHGYEISVVGESENTAKYVGINVRRVVIRTMALSGMLCGLAGFLIIAISQTIAGDAAGGQGFTAIMVAWLAKFNPLMMILSAFLFIFVAKGGQEISTALGHEAAYGDILIGVLLFFIIGCEFFVNYRLVITERGQCVLGKIKNYLRRALGKQAPESSEEREKKENNGEVE